MSKRIFWSVALTAILAVLLTTSVLVYSLYTAHEDSMRRELRQETDCIADALSLIEEDNAYLDKLDSGSRITLIAADGSVLFDNAADASKMENHAARPEVIEALEDGFGESTRTSATLSETTVYYACRTQDGLVLRLSNTRRSMLGTFLQVTPLLAALLTGVVLISLLIARRSARRIVAPINELNLDTPLENDAYDELAPLLTRMDRQHAQIQQHVRALERAHTALTAIMENMREGLILLDRENTVLSINESARRIFHLQEAEIAGQNLLSVNRDADLRDLVGEALTGTGGSMPMERDGRRYRVFVSPVLRDEAVLGTALFFLDETERYAAEESRREFTANVSHELKTPLTSISGFAEIIRDGIAQPQDVRRFAGMICKESARLLTLVNDILALSELDEKQHLGPKESVSLKELLGELVSEFSMAAEKKNLALSLSGDAPEIEGYPLLLREMFFNLIDNAIKYTPEGGRVDVTLAKTDGGVTCRVSDTGVGIPEEHQPHIFERFYRVDKSQSRATGGTGLGLAIVKHVAQIHHAEIALDSAAGKGTSITIRF